MPLVDAESKQERAEWVYGQLERHPNGLTEGEIAELARFGRRSVNNYLRALEAQGRVYKDGLLWLVLPYEETRLRRLALSPEEAMTLYLAGRGTRRGGVKPALRIANVSPASAHVRAACAMALCPNRAVDGIMIGNAT